MKATVSRNGTDYQTLADYWTRRQAALDKWSKLQRHTSEEINKGWRWCYAMLGASGVMAVAAPVVTLFHWYGVPLFAIGAGAWIYGLVRWLLQYRVYSKAKAASKAAEAEYYRIK